MKYWSHDSNVEYRIASNRSPRARRGGNVSSGGDGVRTKDNGNWGRQQRGRDWGCDCGGARTRTRTKTKSSQELAPSGYRANDAQTLKGYLALGSGSNADSSQGVLRPSLRPSLQNLASYITVPPSRSVSGSTSSVPDRTLATRWHAGSLDIVLAGRGGSEGGELKVRHTKDHKQHVCFSHRIPPADSPYGWEVTDVQRLHPSIAQRRHCLSLRFVGAQRVADSRFTLSSIIPRRHKGSVTAMDAFLPEFDFPLEPEDETLLYLSFKTHRERDEWFTIFRALAKVTAYTRRRHRRLDLSIMDLNESLTGVGRASVPGEDTLSVSSTSTDTHRRTLRKPEIVVESERLFPQWSKTEAIKVEVWLDHTLVACTGWNDPGTPFWGERFNLADTRPFSRCTLRLLRRREKGPIVFGTVQIPLVSSFLKAEETRYPIRGVNGVEIGEMRLSVQFQEINVLPIAEYGGVVSVAHADLEAHTAQAVADKLITNNRDGTLEPLCRIALCEGVLMEHVTRMCDEEASADGSTLFRGASPLTKTLEIMLRLMCSDFVEACLGPTIDKVVSEGIGYEGKIGPRTLAVLTELVEMTWTNMYANRHMFPNFIRGALAYLFGKVKEHHDDSVDLCYKAVSSFVFLRLFVPALMSPHLFNLANGLLPAGPRRTLSLVAKVVHQLAFFSENGALRNQELALFRPFLANNREAMIDYILSLASPGAAGAWAHPVSPKINAMAADRREVVDHFHADTIPHMTVAGAIDLGAEWAIVSESWYLRDDVDVDIAAHMDAVHFLAMDIDDGASSIARFATPPPSHHTHGLSRTAASSLTSTPRSARSARSTRSSRSIRSSAYTATDEYGDSLDAVSVGAQSTSGHSIAGSGPIVGSGSAEELSSHHVMDRRSTDVESRESADVCTDIESTNGLMTPSTSDMCSGLASLALEVATDDGLSECSGTTNMTGMTGMTGTTTEGWSKKDRKSLRLKRMRKVAAMGLDEESHNDMPFDEDKEDVIPPVPAIATWSTDWAGSGAPSLKSL